MRLEGREGKTGEGGKTKGGKVQGSMYVLIPYEERKKTLNEEAKWLEIE